MDKREMIMEAAESIADGKEGYFWNDVNINNPNSGVCDQIHVPGSLNFRRIGYGWSENFSFTKPKTKPKKWEICVVNCGGKKYLRMSDGEGGFYSDASINSCALSLTFDHYESTGHFLPEHMRGEE